MYCGVNLAAPAITAGCDTHMKRLAGSKLPAGSFQRILYAIMADQRNKRREGVACKLFP